jgi:hypothetical protein
MRAGNGVAGQKFPKKSARSAKPPCALTKLARSLENLTSRRLELDLSRKQVPHLTQPTALTVKHCNVII